jgi:hypothetical protein
MAKDKNKDKTAKKTSNADIIKLMFNEINEAKDRNYAAYRMHREVFDRLEYYITQWSEAQSSADKRAVLAVNALQAHISNQIELIRDFHIALKRAAAQAKAEKQEWTSPAIPKPLNNQIEVEEAEGYVESVKTAPTDGDDEKEEIEAEEDKVVLPVGKTEWSMDD